MVKTLTQVYLKNGGMTVYVPKQQVQWFEWVMQEGIAGSDDEVFSSDEQRKGLEHFCYRGMDVWKR